MNGSTRTIQVNPGIGGASVATFSRVIRTSSGTAGIIKTGGGILNLNGTSTYNGGTIVNAGTLTMGNAAALGSTSGPLAVNGGTMNMAGFDLTVGNLTGAGGVISGTSNNRTLTIGQGDGTGGNYQGVIANGAAGTTALAKTGTGSLTLSGSNSYTGVTEINAGKLFINGNQSTATGNVTVAANATLGGSGTLGGSTTIADGGKLEFDISTAAGSHNPLDLVTGKGLTFSGASALAITTSGGASPGIYTLITGGNNIGDATLPSLNLPAGWVATVSISGNSLLLNLTSTVASYTVTYDGNGSTGGTVPVDASSPYANGATVTVLGNTGTLARTGHTFAGWNTQANGAGTDYAVASAYTANAAVTLYAKWTMLPYTAWASGTFTNNFTVTETAGNPDGDDLTNLQEFAFGTDPTASTFAPLTYFPNGSASPGHPILENAGTAQSPSYRAVFVRRKDHATAGISYQVEFSANLLHWKAIAVVPEILSGASSAAVEAVGVPFPATVPLSAAETEHAAPGFFRVAVRAE